MKFNDYVKVLTESKESDIEKEKHFTEDELVILKESKLKEIDPKEITYGMGKQYPVKNGIITLKVSPTVNGVFFNVLFQEKGESGIEGLAILTEKHVKVLTKQLLEKFMVDGKKLIDLLKEI